MKTKKTSDVTVLIPLRNGASVISLTLKSLFSQKYYSPNLIIVNNGSTDDSLNEVKKACRGKTWSIKILNFKKPLGFDITCNIGIKATSSKYIVIMHQDILLKDKLSLKKLLLPIVQDEGVVASAHWAVVPLSLWKKYKFWQKVYFARETGKESSGLNEKFDAFRRDALFKVGLFDNKTFFSAGEDEDLARKLAKIGKIVVSEARVIHIHGLDPNFGVKAIIRKHAQYAEAQGVVLRIYGISSIKGFIYTFFREFLAVSAILPFTWVIGVPMVLLYCFVYTKKAYIEEIKNPRILLLPALNIFLLYVSLFYSLRGFVTGKQRL